MGLLALSFVDASAAQANVNVSPALAGDTASAAGAAHIAKATPKRIDTVRWGKKSLRHGKFARTHSQGGIVIGPRPRRVSYDDPYGGSRRLAYDRGRWYSPWHRPGFGYDELIASYNASTPVGTFIEVSVRGVTLAGKRSSWDSLGRWAGHDIAFHRMSPGSQRDDYSRVAVDTVVTNGRVAYRSWQLRVTLMRRAGTGKTPTVTMVAAMASRLPGTSATSSPSRGRAVSLGVPRYSQQIHRGDYPKYDGGGAAWCSPTSTSMVLSFWDRGPTPKQYAWVTKPHPQRWVDHAARSTYAWGYDGSGDWPFNTAYAARFGLDAFVTRLRSLREAEQFVRAGVPLVASIAFGAGELDGAPIRSTSGHVVVIRGFTRDGQVIVNDPAAANARHVRRVYKRAQFENAWLDSTGGVVYVIHPKSTALPAPGRHSNW